MFYERSGGPWLGAGGAGKAAGLGPTGWAPAGDTPNSEPHTSQPRARGNEGAAGVTPGVTGGGGPRRGARSRNPSPAAVAAEVRPIRVARRLVASAASPRRLLCHSPRAEARFAPFLLAAHTALRLTCRAVFCQGPWIADGQTPPGPEGSNGSLLRICRGHPGIFISGTASSLGVAIHPGVGRSIDEQPA